MKRHVATVCFGILLMLSAQSADGYMTAVYHFSFENDGDLTDAPFGTLTVAEGFNTDAGVNTLSFTIDIDKNKFGDGADVHEFGFQLNYAEPIDLVPKPQVVGTGDHTLELKKLDELDKVAGFGSTKWDYVVDFGKGANPTLNPVTFIIGPVPFSSTPFNLSVLDPMDLVYKNNKQHLGTVSNFAVHVQSTGDDREGSEGLGGFYDPMPDPNEIVPELGNTLSALAAFVVGLACLYIKHVRIKRLAA